MVRVRGEEEKKKGHQMGRGAGGKIYDTLGGRYLLRFGFVLARSGLGFLNATFGVGKFAILCALKLGPAKKLGGEMVVVGPFGMGIHGAHTAAPKCKCTVLGQEPPKSAGSSCPS